MLAMEYVVVLFNGYRQQRLSMYSNVLEAGASYSICTERRHQQRRRRADSYVHRLLIYKCIRNAIITFHYVNTRSPNIREAKKKHLMEVVAD